MSRPSAHGLRAVLLIQALGGPRWGASPMNARTNKMTSFIYTIYIHATAEQVWRGLTDPAMTKRYWWHHLAGSKTFRSDWKKGSTWDLEHKDVGLVVSDPEQVILVSDPHRRLSYTWHSFTPGWAAEVRPSRRAGLPCCRT